MSVKQYLLKKSCFELFKKQPESGDNAKPNRMAL
jgi:hypothetical protein